MTPRQAASRRRSRQLGGLKGALAQTASRKLTEEQRLALDQPLPFEARPDEVEDATTAWRRRTAELRAKRLANPRRDDGSA